MNKQETTDAVRLALQQVYAVPNIYRTNALLATALQVGNDAITVVGWTFENQTAGVNYIKFYDAATVPTVGTAPVLFTVEIPANGTVFVPAQAVGQFHTTTKMWMAATTESADSGTTAPGTAVIAQVMYRGW